MPWTAKQKQLFARAAEAAGLAEGQRHMVLSAFPRAHHKGRVTSTAPKLTNADFEQAMAGLERWTGGRVKVAGRDGRLLYEPGHWQARAHDHTQRMRWLAQRIANTLESEGLLEPDGAGLSGWIAKRITPDGRDRLDQLTQAELYNLIEGLKQYGSRNGLRQFDSPIDYDREWTPPHARRASHA